MFYAVLLCLRYCLFLIMLNNCLLQLTSFFHIIQKKAVNTRKCASFSIISCNDYHTYTLLLFLFFNKFIITINHYIKYMSQLYWDTPLLSPFLAMDHRQLKRTRSGNATDRKLKRAKALHQQQQEQQPKQQQQEVESPM